MFSVSVFFFSQILWKQPKDKRKIYEDERHLLKKMKKKKRNQMSFFLVLWCQTRIIMTRIYRFIRFPVRVSDSSLFSCVISASVCVCHWSASPSSVFISYTFFLSSLTVLFMSLCFRCHTRSSYLIDHCQMTHGKKSSMRILEWKKDVQKVWETRNFWHSFQRKTWSPNEKWRRWRSDFEDGKQKLVKESCQTWDQSMMMIMLFKGIQGWSPKIFVIFLESLFFFRSPWSLVSGKQLFSCTETLSLISFLLLKWDSTSSSYSREKQSREKETKSKGYDETEQRRNMRGEKQSKDHLLKIPFSWQQSLFQNQEKNMISSSSCCLSSSKCNRWLRPSFLWPFCWVYTDKSCSFCLESQLSLVLYCKSAMVVQSLNDRLRNLARKWKGWRWIYSQAVQYNSISEQRHAAEQRKVHETWHEKEEDIEWTRQEETRGKEDSSS